MDIILSIKPSYAKKILSGEKTYELRRVVPARNIETVYLYETAPVQMVTGKFTVKAIHYNIPLARLWEMVRKGCCLTAEEFYKYFDTLFCGNAIEISEFAVIPAESIDNLGNKDKYPIETAPQNYCYTCGIVDRSLDACLSEIGNI